MPAKMANGTVKMQRQGTISPYTGLSKAMGDDDEARSEEKTKTLSYNSNGN
jgi:hypothetical protein